MKQRLVEFLVLKDFDVVIQADKLCLVQGYKVGALKTSYEGLEKRYKEPDKPQGNKGENEEKPDERI